MVRRSVGQMRKYLSQDYLKRIVNAFVTLYLDYCNIAFRCCTPIT